MTEYISKKETYKTLTEYYHHKTQEQHRSLREALNRVPVADVRENERGKWLYTQGSVLIKPHITCPNCLSMFYEHYAPHVFKFCPNCGMAMESE